ncbi:YwqJ-like deaminase [Thermoactinomyces sp. DSM 45891]|uniref:YwqJ-related putative deaminase n=1 Tax=Thermoactinomyces sp. DSM 45891 TaxID=1761907 RepID=UPI0009160054|nr:YwqJ-related putative deaminase [Thermoactinomyces sp. DSM 45891]SFX12028.1 YwqJ-like deaminase [Thermoactinomyces sp. DSM 45891]
MRNNTNRKRLSKFLLIMMVVFLSFGYIGNGVSYAVDFNIDNTPINGGFNQDIAQTSTATEKGWLESAGDWVSDKWDGFTDWCGELWDDVNNILDDLGAKIQGIMDTAWKWALAIGSAATLAWALLKKQIPALQAVEWAFSFIKGVLRGLADIVIGVFDLVVGALGLIGYIILNPIESGKKLWHWITHPGEVWNNLTNMVGGVWNEITESWDQMVVNGDANSRSEWLGYAATQIVGIFVGSKGLDKAGKAGFVLSKTGGISSKFPLASKAFDAISDSFKGFGDKVKSFGDNLFGNAKRILATTTAGTMLLTGITFVWPKIEPYIMKFSDCVAIQQQDTGHYFASIQLAGKLDCPSGNSSQALDETILPKGVNDDILKSRGFSKQELDSLVKYVNNEASALKNSGLTKKQLGAAVATTFDKKSGKYYTAINNMDGDLPKELHPLIDSKINGMPSSIKESYIKTHGSGSHAEVYAINKALLDGANPKDLMTYVVKSGGTVKPLGDPFPMCPHCSHILQDFFVATN